MGEKKIVALIAKFEAVARNLTYKWSLPGEWEEIYSEMCCTFAKKNSNLEDKPLTYIVKVCKNEAINNYFKGKSICAKPRRGVKMISFEELSERIAVGKRFEEDVHNRLLVEKILALLTERQKQVAEGIMQGSTEQQIAGNLGISRQRVNDIKKSIRQKAKKVLNRGLLFC